MVLSYISSHSTTQLQWLPKRYFEGTEWLAFKSVLQSHYFFGPLLSILTTVKVIITRNGNVVGFT
jgi:hypothetical protein